MPFYVLEHVANAKPITNYAHDLGLSLTDRLRLFKQVCEAVSHGHDRSIVHRDLKPGNILVDAAGNPKVIDFGVARSTDSDLALEAIRTDTGQMIGTVQFMAPEQFGPNPDDLNSRTDVYALGVVLYELLSGVPPYSVSKRALHEASRVVCEQVPTPLRSLDKSIPRDVSNIAERCLQKDRRHRYHTAGELAADIGRFLSGQPVRAQSSGIRVHQALQKLSNNKIWAAVVLAALALGAWWFFSQQNQKPAPNVAASTPPPPQPPGNTPPPRAPEQVLPPVPQQPPRPEPPLEPQVAFFEASSAWAKSGLIVREGGCYSIKVTGECRDSSGRKFSPDGPTPRANITILGAPKNIKDNRTYWELFTHNHPRQMLTAKVGNAPVIMAIGSGLTFFSPGDGELEFRLNDSLLGDEGSRGKLSLELTPVPEPPLVSSDGTTTVITRVGDLKYLLFEPDGLRWDYRSVLATDAENYPTLINGIAWWPPRDVRQLSRSTILKTSLFSWAAGPKPLEPKVVITPSANAPHAEVKPGVAGDGTPALTFSDPETSESEVSCRFSRP